jgi:DNA-binding response OmpR family regulator
MYSVNISVRKTHMEEEPMNVLIIGFPRYLQASLEVLLSAQSNFGRILKAETFPLAQEIFFENLPRLVLLDFGQPDDELIDFLRRARERQPRLYVIGIVDRPLRIMQALQAGVNSVLVRRFSYVEWMARMAEVQAW